MSSSLISGLKPTDLEILKVIIGMKKSFKLLNRDMTFVAAACAETLSTYSRISFAHAAPDLHKSNPY